MENSRMVTNWSLWHIYDQSRQKITSRQRPVFFFFFSATDGKVKNGHELILMARLWSIAAINNLSTTASFFVFFSATDGKVKNGHELILMARSWSIAAIVFWFCFIYTAAVRQKLSTILSANVANLTHFVTLTFWFKTLLKLLVYFISIH